MIKHTLPRKSIQYDTAVVTIEIAVQDKNLDRAVRYVQDVLEPALQSAANINESPRIIAVRGEKR